MSRTAAICSWLRSSKYLTIRQRFHLDAPGWYRDRDPVPHLPAVADALWQDQVIEVRYRRWSPRPGEVTRSLHPLGLVLKAGVWYLVAAGHGEPRTYRVSSIVSLRPLAERVTRPDGWRCVPSSPPARTAGARPPFRWRTFRTPSRT